MPPLLYGAATDKGNVRDNNEDSLLSDVRHNLWLIADGMGGHEAGEIASAIVRDTVSQRTASGDSLSEAIRESHRAVLRAVESGQGATGMGSTIVALRNYHDHYEICWVGDSRAYLWSHDEAGDGHLEQLTIDHSYVQMLVDSGVLNEEDMDSHPDKNIITQCLGARELKEVVVDSIQRSWEDNQWLLLCSDGLTDELDSLEIADVLSNSATPQIAAEQLMEKALSNGGRDNVSIQVIEAPKSSSPIPSSVTKALHRWRHVPETLIPLLIILAAVLYLILGAD